MYRNAEKQKNSVIFERYFMQSIYIYAKYLDTVTSILDADL